MGRRGCFTEMEAALLGVVVAEEAVLVPVLLLELAPVVLSAVTVVRENEDVEEAVGGGDINVWVVVGAEIDTERCETELVECETELVEPSVTVGDETAVSSDRLGF